MQINKHFSFHPKRAPELYQYLKENSIQFKEGEIICSADMLDSNIHWTAISALISKYGITCFSKTIFSQQELSEAQWLSVRSQWRNGYPQPESKMAYKGITYSRDAYCDKCGSGLYQTNMFRFKQPVKWGRRNFMFLNWVEDELFIRDIARATLEVFSGVSFEPVLNKSGQQILEGVSQMKISSILERGLIEELSPIRETSHCEHCGNTKYVTTGIGSLAYPSSIFASSPDIVKSAELFGSGALAFRLIFVRQSVYQAIVANKLDRDLVFEPLKLIDV